MCIKLFDILFKLIFSDYFSSSNITIDVFQIVGMRRKNKKSIWAHFKKVQIFKNIFWPILKLSFNKMCKSFQENP